jgi:hypothetical protein
MIFMESILSHPAFQSAIAPFAASLLVALVLRRAGSRWQGFAILAGWLAVVGLAMGFQFDPLTSTRKIVLLSAILPLIALVLEQPPLEARTRSSVMAGLSAAAMLWILWPVLARAGLAEALPQAVGLLTYVVFVVLAFGRLARGRVEPLGGTALALSLGTGGAAILGASALYGQLGFALAAASGGLILAWLIRPHLSALGSMAAMAVAVPLAFIGAAGIVYADLSWWVLPCLALVPVAVWVGWKPIGNMKSVWGRMILVTLAGLIPALLGVWISWQSSGDMVY